MTELLDVSRLEAGSISFDETPVDLSALVHEVVARLEDGGQGERIEVADGGIGLAPNLSDRLFQPFERGTNADHVPGMGLGLYLCRQIVERHGGRISAHSAGPDQGTTVTVWLPRTPPRASDASIAV